MKTKVFITIDTEFSINGAFKNPTINSPIGEQAVLCKIGEKSHGLGFLLETFKEFDIPATFFIEVFNTYFFGDQPMRDIARQVQAAGHDLQLHLHPCWTYFKDSNWVNRLQEELPTDNMDGHSLEQLCAWIKDGIEIFERWGLNRPLAFRTGNLITDKTVYDAMAVFKLHLASNIGVGIYKPKEPELSLYSGLHLIGNILEACLLTYIDHQLGSYVHHQVLTITGTSTAETCSLLLQAHASNIQAVVILTHPSEFVKFDRIGYTNMRPNRINQKRLRELCAFVTENDAKFEAASISQLNTLTIPPDMPNIQLKAPWLLVAGRIIENAINDHLRFSF